MADKPCLNCKYADTCKNIPTESDYFVCSGWRWYLDDNPSKEQTPHMTDRQKQILSELYKAKMIIEKAIKEFKYEE